MLELSRYAMQRKRPAGKPLMAQNWRRLLFLHFDCDPEEIQALLPSGLTVDTFATSVAPSIGPSVGSKEGEAAMKERAWVGLVPFYMEDVAVLRPTRLPIGSFPETNVRTYVYDENGTPGVWFFSLDAVSGSAGMGGRLLYSLPYHRASMQMTPRGGHVVYTGQRRKQPHPGYKLECSFDPSFAPVEPGTLEYFLIERYVLFTERRGRILSGQVHHLPYTVAKADFQVRHDALIHAAGIRPRPFVHGLYCPGVDVEIYGLNRTP